MAGRRRACLRHSHPLGLRPGRHPGHNLCPGAAVSAPPAAGARPRPGRGAVRLAAPAAHPARRLSLCAGPGRGGQHLHRRPPGLPLEPAQRPAPQLHHRRRPAAIPLAQRPLLHRRRCPPLLLHPPAGPAAAARPGAAHPPAHSGHRLAHPGLGRHHAALPGGGRLAKLPLHPGLPAPHGHHRRRGRYQPGRLAGRPAARPGPGPGRGHHPRPAVDGLRRLVPQPQLRRAQAGRPGPHRLGRCANRPRRPPAGLWPDAGLAAIRPAGDGGTLLPDAG